jgi:hypothetical protein
MIAVDGRRVNGETGVTDDDVKEISGLVDNLESHRQPEFREHRLGWALRLGDLFRHPGEVTFMTGTLQRMIDRVVPLEKDREVRNELFNGIDHACSKNLSVDLSLDELMRHVGDDDPALTCNILLLLAHFGDRKHKPFVEKYLTHQNEFIRRNAEHAWQANTHWRDV